PLIYTLSLHDALPIYWTDPVGHPFFIHFKTQVIENIGRIAESQMAVDISVKMITGRILHSLVQLHQLCILSRHIDLNIGRDPIPDRKSTRLNSSHVSI